MKKDTWIRRETAHQRLDGLMPGSTTRPRPPQGAQPKQGKPPKKGGCQEVDRCVGGMIEAGVTLTPTNRKERKKLNHFLYCIERKNNP